MEVGCLVDGHSRLINPRRACAAGVTVVGLCVWLSVCPHLFWNYIQATDTSGFKAIYASLEKKGNFPETTVFQRYAVKTSEKA
jgi:hypothetical protein